MPKTRSSTMAHAADLSTGKDAFYVSGLTGSMGISCDRVLGAAAGPATIGANTDIPLPRQISQNFEFRQQQAD